MDRIDRFKIELENTLNNNNIKVDKKLEENILSSFILNGANILITKNGEIIKSEDLPNETNILLGRLIFEAQNKAKITMKLAIKNIDFGKLDTFIYKNNKYYLLMQWKNVVLAFTDLNILGYTYAVGIKAEIDNIGYKYVDFDTYDDINNALLQFNRKGQIEFESISSPFNEDELDALLYSYKEIDIKDQSKKIIEDLCSAMSKLMTIKKIFKDMKK